MSTKPKLLYWDTDVWAEWNDNKKGDSELLRSMLKDAEAGELVMVVSALTLAEFAPRNSEVDTIFEDYFKRSSFRMVQFNVFLATKARSLVREHHLGGADAVHLASATYAGADYMFTYDNRLLRAAPNLTEIRVSKPTPFGQLKFGFSA